MFTLAQSVAILAAAQAALAAPIQQVKRDAALAPPQSCMTMNGIGVGWLPDTINGKNIYTITDTLGGQPNPCYIGYFDLMSDWNWDGSTTLGKVDEAKTKGSVLQIALQPTGIRFADFNSDLAQKVAGVMKQVTDQGVHVHLRLAHEFNGYVRPETGPLYPGGTPQEFIQMWKNVAIALQPLRSAGMLKMLWNPNEIWHDGSETMETLREYYPQAESDGTDYVELIGYDFYPKPADDPNLPNPRPTFDYAYQKFYEDFPKTYAKPFIIPETAGLPSGTDGSDDGSNKQWWLGQLLSADVKAKYPNYSGMSYFEYNKPGEHDWRVVTGAQDWAAGHI